MPGGDLALGDDDVFVNVVGGLRISETAVDLPSLLAIVSSFRDRATPARLVCFGEIGLAGEIRPVKFGAERIAAAAKAGDGRFFHITGLTHDEQGYPLVYLTGRPYALTDITRGWLAEREAAKVEAERRAAEEAALGAEAQKLEKALQTTAAEGAEAH